MTPKTVWILGSGFSRALGGPTLAQLLSPAAFHSIAVRYEGEPWWDRAALTTLNFLFQYGVRFENGWPEDVSSNTEGERMWQHAEEFLDLLDAVTRAPDGPAAKRLLGLHQKHVPRGQDLTIGRHRSLARRVVAVECADFVDDAPIDREQWIPYITWAKTLRFSDTVITFNYDCVLEKLQAAGVGAKFRIVVPGDGQMSNNTVPVFKLHGSVNWKRIDGAHVEAQDDLNFARTCRDEDLALAMPGPSKQEEIRQLFEPLWTTAEDSLKQADRIIFVGYRFPPSDAEARARLLSALSMVNHGHARTASATLRRCGWSWGGRTRLPARNPLARYSASP